MPNDTEWMDAEYITKEQFVNLMFNISEYHRKLIRYLTILTIILALLLVRTMVRLEQTAQAGYYTTMSVGHILNIVAPQEWMYPDTQFIPNLGEY